MLYYETLRSLYPNRGTPLRANMLRKDKEKEKGFGSLIHKQSIGAAS